MKKFCFLLIAFIVMATGSVVHGSVNVTVFEETFIRGTGAPVPENRTFPSLSGPATIIIFNGGLEDSSLEKVSSTTIMVNGQLIFDPSDFNQMVGRLEKEIDLQEGQNDLEVLLKSKPGGRIRIEIIQQTSAAGYILPTSPEEIRQDTATGIKYVIGQILITAEDTATKEDIENIVSIYGGNIVGVINFVDIYQVKFEDLTYDKLTSIGDNLMAEEAVKVAVINEVYETNADLSHTNDPWSDAAPGTGDASFWNVYPWEDNLGCSNNVPQGNAAPYESMRLPELWEEFYGSFTSINKIPPIKIGIIDSDFPAKAEDSTNVLQMNPVADELNFAWVNRDGDIQGPQNYDYTHGHRVASIIGATPNNYGTAGVAWNAQLYGYKSNLARIDVAYAIVLLLFEHKVDLINLSGGINRNLGLFFDCNVPVIVNDPDLSSRCKALTEQEKELYRKVYYQSSNKFYTEFFKRIQSTGKDFLFVQAAGNVNTPSELGGWANSVTDKSVRRNLLVVGSYSVGFRDYSITKGDSPEYARTTFDVVNGSSFGPNVDIYGPGGSFRYKDYCGTDQTYNVYSGFCEYTNNNEICNMKYNHKWGTSFAAPFLTGLAAIIKQSKGESFSWPRIKTSIIEGSKKGHYPSENKSTSNVKIDIDSGKIEHAINSIIFVDAMESYKFSSIFPDSGADQGFNFLDDIFINLSVIIENNNGGPLPIGFLDYYDLYVVAKPSLEIYQKEKMNVDTAGDWANILISAIIDGDEKVEYNFKFIFEPKTYDNLLTPVIIEDAPPLIFYPIKNTVINYLTTLNVDTSSFDALPSPAPRASFPLNDTGIDWCADDINLLDCPVAGYHGQDGEHGRDAQARAGTLVKVGGGAAGFDFTKLDANGNDLPASAFEWSCVRDNHTGLIWEVKTTNGLRNQYNTYSWYNSDSATNGGDAGTQNGGSCSGSDCDTQAFVQAVNAAGLCGAGDWRLPTVQELLSIYHNGVLSPAIDLDYFPNTPSTTLLHTWFWSSSPSALYADCARYFSFYDGHGDFTLKVYSGRVRLVRAGQ